MTRRVERFDEIDYNGGFRVKAKLSAELVNLRTGATLWTGDAAQTLRVDTRNVGFLRQRNSTSANEVVEAYFMQNVGWNPCRGTLSFFAYLPRAGLKNGSFVTGTKERVLRGRGSDGNWRISGDLTQNQSHAGTLGGQQ